MTDYSAQQRLLMQIREEFCDGNAAKLAREIGKDGTYVNRLFYPIGKKGRKGIGLEIMAACTARFGLPPGYWERDPLQADQPGKTGQSNQYFQTPILARECSDFFEKPQWPWPFLTISPEQYFMLGQDQRLDVEKYIQLQVRLHDPPAKHDAPEENTETIHKQSARSFWR